MALYGGLRTFECLNSLHFNLFPHVMEEKTGGNQETHTEAETSEILIKEKTEQPIHEGQKISYHYDHRY